VTLNSRLDKLYDRLKGEFITLSMNDGRQCSISKDEILRLLVATIKATASSTIGGEGEGWLKPEDVAFIQNIAPGQDDTIDLMQRMVASLGGGEDDQG